MAYTDPNDPYNTMPYLPPKADIETVRIWKACTAAKVSLARMREAGKLIPNPEILIRSLPLLEANASSQIENIFTTCDALYRAISVPEMKMDPATKEVMRYREALNVGIDELKSGKKLGEILLTHVCSVLRGQETDRRCAGADIFIKGPEGRVYTPPDDPIILEKLIHQLEDYINDGNEPDVLIRMALIHYQFEAIHPFNDANGRTGRILSILYLIDQDLLDIPILYLSRYIIQRKSEYYSRLRRVTENEEWEEWIIFMLSAIRETADWTYDRIRAIKSLLDETITECKEKLPKIYSSNLVETIFLQPYCKSAFLVARGIGNRQTAMKYLKALEAVGILESMWIGKERIFVNTKLFALLNTENKNTPLADGWYEGIVSEFGIRAASTNGTDVFEFQFILDNGAIVEHKCSLTDDFYKKFSLAVSDDIPVITPDLIDKMVTISFSSNNLHKKFQVHVVHNDVIDIRKAWQS